MIHELLLLLHGHDSTLLSPTGLPPTFPLVSPSERELITQLSQLGHKHIYIRTHSKSLSTTHPSPIVRAVASSILSVHLQAFRQQIVDVEASIIKRDTKIVGAYDIVPLAQLLVEFEGWERILGYLKGLTDFLRAKDGEVTGTKTINRLRADIHTGFPDLEKVSLHLLSVAEMTWLRQVSTWVLFGRIPSFGAGDFFVVEGESGRSEEDNGLVDDVVLKEYHINKTLVPSFVEPHTASSILFIGKALAHIRSRSGASNRELSISSNEITPVSVHLSHLQSLKSPFSSQQLSSAISAIRLSLSKHTLQTLLPAHKISEIIQLFREFYLLGRGEFAMALVEQASLGVRNRFRRLPGAGGQDDLQLLATPLPSKQPNVSVKEGEVAAILSRVWGVISAFQQDPSQHDERLDLARDLLYLTIQKAVPPTPGVQRSYKVEFNDLLLGVPLNLSFHLSWPMELFLSQSEIETYNDIFSYLLAVRKAQIAVQSLWRGRRPVRELLSASKEEAKKRRIASRQREKRERELWATCQLVGFFLKTLGGYWQGEVVESSFRDLMEILDDKDTKSSEDETKPESIDDDMDIDMDASLAPEEEKPKGTRWVHEHEDHDEEKTRDPETLTIAHTTYLSNLRSNLFLTDAHFPSLLRSFLLAIDTLVADMSTLSSKAALRSLGVDSDIPEYSDEKDLERARESCRYLKELLGGLMERLHVMDEERVEEREGGMKIDRLLMRLGLSGLRGDDGVESEEELVR